jgi:two-component system, chemotaxis family, response regulator Rcp1
VRETVRVLVAEDNEDHLFFITRALQAMENVTFEVAAVHDGSEALDFIYQRGGFAGQPRPHMILLDLKMPRVQGIEVLEILKSDPELRSIPIAVLTSSDRQQDVDASYRAGTNTYVIKRPTFSDLRQELQAVSDFWTNVAVLPQPPN